MRNLPAILAAASALALGASTARAQDIGNFINFGCQGVHSHINGCFVTSIQGPGEPGDIPRGQKVGKACGWNLLALISVGDVRIETAMKNGGITQVSSVDYEAFQLVPFFYGYGRFCTVVHGN